MANDQAKGVASPYPDDPETYLWDWCQDEYVFGSRKYVPARPMFIDEAVSLMRDSGFAATEWPSDWPHPNELIKDSATELKLWYNIAGQPLAFEVHHPDYGATIVNHPSWSSVDWEHHAHY